MQRFSQYLCAIAIVCYAAGNSAFAQSNPASRSAQNSEKVNPVNLWRPGDPGKRIFIDGRVTDSEKNPIEGAIVYTRQADGNGVYTPNYQGKMVTDKQGRYAFGSVLPGQYGSIQHIHVVVDHQFFESVVTEINFKGDPNLDRASEEHGIFLEKAGGDDILYGRFDIEMRLPGQ